MNTEELKMLFKKIFNDTSDSLRLFFSPGRVNLIGEHIDYNGGKVLPCALTLGTYAVVKERTDGTVRVYSDNFKEVGIKEIQLSDLSHKPDEKWTVYVKGVMVKFIEAGYKINKGFDALISGNIPNGSGLSSSASLELLTAIILKQLNGLNIELVDMVKLSQKAENQYVGVNCGIMDQFAIGFGKTDNAVLLDCNTLNYSYVPVKLGDVSILIMNTNKKRELADSKYNERRSECDKALEVLKKYYSVNALCDISLPLLEAVKYSFDDVIYKRAKHAVSENDRVKEAAQCMNKNNLKRFGQLLNDSHSSLKELYEVTGKELDTIVELAQKQKGVLGARMTGAGFGGCAIALVKNKDLNKVIETVGKEYKKVIGYEATFYVAQIGNGTMVL